MQPLIAKTEIRTCFIFYHLERCAGSTINSWFAAPSFERNVNKHVIHSAIYNHNEESILGTLSSPGPTKSFFLSGHFSPGPLQFVASQYFDKVFAFTRLRNPTERVLSAYKLYCQKEEWWKKKSASHPSFYEWARAYPAYATNLISRRFSGGSSTNASDALLKMIESCEVISLDSSNLSDLLARINLEAEMAGVALVPNYNKANATEGIKIENRQDIAKWIIDNNQEDILLYNLLKRISHSGLINASHLRASRHGL